MNAKTKLMMHRETGHRLDKSIDELGAEWRFQTELGNSERAKMVDEMRTKLIWIKNTEVRDLRDAGK